VLSEKVKKFSEKESRWALSVVKEVIPEIVNPGMKPQQGFLSKI
jgi:hypothetical protein